MNTSTELINEHIDQVETASGPVSVGKRDAVPDAVTVIADSITFNGAVHGRGSVIQLDTRTIAATVDREGKTFLSDLSEASQIKRWNRIMLAEGDCADELREADRMEREAAHKAQERARERDGTNVLRELWLEEKEAARKPRRMRSTTTSQKVVPMN